MLGHPADGAGAGCGLSVRGGTNSEVSVRALGAQGVGIGRVAGSVSGGRRSPNLPTSKGPLESRFGSKAVPQPGAEIHQRTDVRREAAIHDLR